MNVKTLSFALAIIVGICGIATLGLSAAALGAHQGWWHASALGHLAKLDITLIALDGGVASLFLLIGVGGIVRNRMANSAQEVAEEEVRQDAVVVVQDATTESTPRRERKQVYGPDAYGKWNIQLVDTKIPSAPTVDWEAHDPCFEEPLKNNYILFYMPAGITSSDSQVRPFNFEALKSVTGNIQGDLNAEGVDQPHPGWKLMSIRPLPEDKTLEDTEYRIPFAFEAAVLHQLVLADNQERLFSGQESSIMCADQIVSENKTQESRAMVQDFNGGLHVYTTMIGLINPSPGIIRDFNQEAEQG